MRKASVLSLTVSLILSTVIYAFGSDRGINLLNTYSKYGISFKYPSDMVFASGDQSESNGELQGSCERTDVNLMHALELRWSEFSSESEEEKTALSDIDSLFEAAGFFTPYPVDPGSSNPMFVPKDKGAKKINGHKLVYKLYEYTKTDTVPVFSINSIWYCKESKRLFMFNVVFTEKNILPLFENYLASFSCHSKWIRRREGK